MLKVLILLPQIEMAKANTYHFTLNGRSHTAEPASFPFVVLPRPRRGF